MTNTKCKFIVKVFISIILSVVFLVCVFSPFALVSVVAADENTEDVNLFIGYSDGTIDIHEATRLTSPSSDAPSFTVLVHGQGGDASDWSNDANYEFAYDSNSLIETLRSIAPNSEVLWVLYNLTKITKGGLKNHLFLLQKKTQLLSFIFL